MFKTNLFVFSITFFFIGTVRVYEVQEMFHICENLITFLLGYMMCHHLPHVLTLTKMKNELSFGTGWEAKNFPLSGKLANKSEI